MTEAYVVHNSAKPLTQQDLEDALKKARLCTGMTIIVHASLSRLGWVCGGAVTVIRSLMSVLTSHGTLIMPTPTPGYTDPKYWKRPPFPNRGGP